MLPLEYKPLKGILLQELENFGEKNFNNHIRKDDMT
jgi:hypothetical protein